MSIIPEKLILEQHQSPGDYLCCLAAIESLHIQYPGKYLTDLHCIYPHLFDNHPNITRMSKNQGRVIKMECPQIHQSHITNVTFLATWVHYLGQQLNLPLELKVNHPTIYLSDAEKKLPRLKNTWLINSSYKGDCPAKHWSFWRYQQLVEALPDINFIQVGESFHHWRPLEGPNITCMVGKTDKDCRALIRLASQVEAGIGGVSFLGHIMAALSKPYVSINLREPPHFAAYPTTTTLSSMGKMPCCKDRACWASEVNPSSKGGGNRCTLPVLEKGEWTPQCAELITVATVAESIRSYRHISAPSFDMVQSAPKTVSAPVAKLAPLPALPPGIEAIRNRLIGNIRPQRVLTKNNRCPGA